MHLSETGFPFSKRGSNTYIAGHAREYDRSRSPNIFRNLDTLRQGDLIALRDANDKVYKYRVYERLVVDPRDVWVIPSQSPIRRSSHFRPASRPHL